MNKLYLTLEHVAKSYARSVLRDVNLTVTNDSYVTILGKSGSGKSTMLNILGLLEDYDAGEYRLNGTLIRNGRDYARLRAENIGFIFQSYNLISTMTCRENIEQHFQGVQIAVDGLLVESDTISADKALVGEMAL